jgi:hypothetical protein
VHPAARAIDHGPAEAAIAKHVELKPERLLHHAAHVLDRADRHGGQAEFDSSRLGGAGRQHLAVTVNQAGEPGRRDRDRHRDGLAQHRGGERDLGYVDQHTLPQADRVQIDPIGGERQLVIRAALDVVEDGARDFLPCNAPQILDIGDDRHGMAGGRTTRVRKIYSD